ncbi:MAG: rod shape-determining protein MreC [Ectothiorhodospiraceae bacterium]|nr:rod shape-determining protein MreC [Ectothiorhodospiraceae bacterium]
MGPSPAVRLVALVLLSVVLMVADHRHHHLQTARNLVALALYPVQYVVDLPSRLFHWASEQVISHDELIRDNRALRQEQLLLRAELLKLTALEQENARLRELLESSSKQREHMVIAEILAVDLDPFRQRLVLNKGSLHGVYPGQPVINANGVLGQIVEVHHFTSVAMLISDPSHALPVQVDRTGLRTIAVGRGHHNLLELRFIPTNEDVQEGDLISTTGLGGSFPGDYPVAEITLVERTPGESFARIEARPLARIDRSREVLLVWSSDDVRRGQELAPTAQGRP